MVPATNPHDPTGRVPCWLGVTTHNAVAPQRRYDVQLNRLTLPVSDLWHADGYEWLRDVQTGYTWAWPLSQMQ